ncbi:MAG TPA: RES domain-containing protein [Rhodopila sp.]|nr:RES domain-containing protein [Rhodopila sp.]
MIGWRLCRRVHADLTGEGAQRYGGRWNSPGHPVVYLADHPALAALEVRVHLDLPFDLLPADFILMRVAVPDCPADGLTTSADTVAKGDAWLTGLSSATVRVASVLVPHAWNVLLNPRHPDARQAETQAIEPFRFDPRLWQPLATEG